MVATSSNDSESLEEAQQTVKKEAGEMKRNFEKEDVEKGIEHAGLMLDKLRTSTLTPSQYNELFMSVTNELRHLSLYLDELIDTDNGLEVGSTLYEKVQYNNSIIPRLYLMITVGSCMLKHRPELTRAVLDDLVEMSRGVQHPVRGIFLRNYLLQSTRSILPDIQTSEINENEKTEEETEEHGTVDDSIEMLLKNFTEMNKLWVRIQYQGNTRQANQRRAERQEVRNLVGANLHRLSQLEGLTIDKYSNHVLPELLQQIVNCRDTLAQSYLMESIIQVFPDEYHLDTMKSFLKATAALHTTVNAKSIVIALVDRLSNYALTEKTKLEGKDGDLFTVFTEQLSQIIEGRESLELDDVLSMEASLMHLALTCYPEQIEYIDKIMETTGDIINQYLISNNLKSLPSSSSASREIISLIKLPITQYSSAESPIKILKLKSLQSALDVLSIGTRKIIAAYFVDKIIENDVFVTMENLKPFLGVIQCLYQVSVEADKPDEEDLDLASRCVDLLDKSNQEKHFEMLQVFQEEFNKAGLEQKSKLLPSIFSQVCEIGLKMNEDGKTALCEKAFEMAHETVKLLANDDLAMIPIRLYLQGVSYLQNCNYSGAVDLCYEFFTQAFVLYEDEISDSKEQVWALQLLSGTLLEMECFKEEEHGSLRSQLALASARLLRKADQTRSILSVCQVLWSSKVKQDNGTVTALRDSKKVATFIGKAIKTTEKCLESELKVQLYVEILEKIYNFKCDGYNSDLMDPHQEQITKKIEGESINNHSIEEHWNRIKILLNPDGQSLDNSEKIDPEPRNDGTNNPDSKLQPDICESVVEPAKLEITETESAVPNETPEVKSTEVEPTEIEPTEVESTEVEPTAEIKQTSDPVDDQAAGDQAS